MLSDEAYSARQVSGRAAAAFRVRTRLTTISDATSAAAGSMLAIWAPSSITPGRCRIRQSISRSKHFGIMKPKPQALIYTILADDKPIAALEANATEARELLKERWFRQELSRLKSGRTHLQAETSTTRPAGYGRRVGHIRRMNASTADDADEVLFVYLVDLDRE